MKAKTTRENLFQRIPERHRDELTDSFGEESCGKKVSAENREKFQLEKLGSGCFRSVFAFTPSSNVGLDDPENYVLKLVIGSPWANEQEVYVYEEISRRIRREYLVPIIDHGPDFYWIIMERAETEEKVEQKEERDVKDSLFNQGWMYEDMKRNNMGYHQGVPKIIDYGYYWERTASGECLEV